MSSGFEERNIKIIGIGLDAGKLQAEAALEKSLLYEDKIIDKEVKFLYIGRVCEDKGVHVSVKALRVIKDRMPHLNIQFNIIGNGPKKYLDYLKTLIHDLGLEGCVVLHGFMKYEDAIKMYGEHDIFLFPYIWEEPFGVTILEAMSLGVPVITSSHGGGYNIIQNMVDGILVANGSFINVAEASEILIHDRILYNTIRKNAIKKVCSAYSFEKMIQKREACLLSAIENNDRLSVTIIANGFQNDYVINILNSLAESNIKIDFIGSDIYELDKINSKVNFINLRGTHEESVSLFLKMNRVIKYYLKLLIYTVKSSNKIFHILWLRFNFFDGVIFPIILKLNGKRVVYTVHDVVPHMCDNLYNRIVFFLVYQTVDDIVVHTEYIKLRIRKEFFIDGKKIKIIKHGVYAVGNHFVTRSIARRTFGLNDEDIVLLFFGRIAKYKGIDVLLKAFYEAGTKYKNIHLIIAGEIEKCYKMEFMKILPDDIRIIKKIGFIDEKDVQSLFISSDLVVLPYLEASQSGVLFLSYAYGKPVVISNIGGFPEDVIIGSTGYLFRKSEYRDLAEKIDLCIKDFTIDREHKENLIKEYANYAYSWRKSCEDLIKKIYVDIKES
jgi:glycosyltransferase involved in cell wall biosynthesis